MKETTRRPYAHTLADHDEAHWEPLSIHLSHVATMAESFTSIFAPTGWGTVLGQCHDLGKASDAFQSMLHAANTHEAENAGAEDSARAKQRVDHSTFGARYVIQHTSPGVGELLAYCIAGHHAGLPNRRATDDATAGSTLEQRLSPERPIHAVADPGLTLPLLTMNLRCTGADQPFALAFFTRMLFSCLIDADRLCTQRFCDQQQAVERDIARPSIAALGTALATYLSALSATAPDTPVNRQRAFVLQQCVLAATAKPGFFSLQVPTGGGKTLSSLAFALDHARANGLQRVVLAIPFTSIIEQTADVYRVALGPLATHGLVEHHTNLKPEHDSRANQNATENWDAPLIVTTNVQLFESLFAARTTPCRKLHRLAKSVVILDEAQTLPVELLAPTLRALRELVDQYGCTVVLCTATQPALERREGFAAGIEGAVPIIADPTPLFAALQRVRVIKLPGRQTTQQLADRIAVEPKVLAIVNTKADAAALFDAVRSQADPSSCFHLSTLMCGAHRRRVLATIRKLVTVSPCRVISTQLVEAGVDLDFPVVYRAEAGFDSIAQAAGRCNREGKLPGLGTTYVFEGEKPPPRGSLRQAAETAKELWPQHPDPLAPSAIHAYFRHRYWQSSDVLDKNRVLDCMDLDRPRRETRFQFRDIEDRYKIIDNNEIPILVPYDTDGQKYLAQLLSLHVPFVLHRLLQPYLVSVPERIFQALVCEHIVQLHESGVGLLLRNDAYDDARGLRVEKLGLDVLSNIV